MKLSRLRGRKANDYLRREGKVWRGTTMTIRWLKGHPRNREVDHTDGAVYVGVSASTKLHKSAVKRNRMQRRCREALRKEVKNYEKLPTVQLLMSPRRASLDCDVADIHTDVVTFLRQIV